MGGRNRFITIFTRTRYLSLFWARSIQSMPPSHFLNIHFNIILPSTPQYSKWFLLSGLHTCTLNHLWSSQYVPLAPPISSMTDHLNNIWWRYRSWSLSLCTFLHSLTTCSSLDPNTSICTLFLDNVSLGFSLIVRVSHPYKVTGSIFIHIVLGRKAEDKRFCTKW